VVTCHAGVPPGRTDGEVGPQAGPCLNNDIGTYADGGLTPSATRLDLGRGHRNGDHVTAELHGAEVEGPFIFAGALHHSVLGARPPLRFDRSIRNAGAATAAAGHWDDGDGLDSGWADMGAHLGRAGFPYDQIDQARLRAGAGFASSPLSATTFPEINTSIAHLRDVLGGQTYESLAHKGETMTTAEMVTYAYDQIDQARTELNAVS